LRVAVHVASAAAVVLAFAADPSSFFLLWMALAHVLHKAIIGIKRVAADCACHKNEKFLQHDMNN
jgi:hypothetical protein